MTITALPVVDRLERDGRTLLLLEHTVVELSPLALAAYDTASTGVTIAVLSEELVNLFGQPADGDVRGAVARTVGELTTLGLVEVTHPGG